MDIGSRLVYIWWLIAGSICSAVFAVSAYSWSNMKRHQFLGVYLGMSEKSALQRMSKLGSGAGVGDLCSGNYGVGVHLKHQGYDWQFMAHTVKGTVRELKLYRFDSRGTENKEQCLKLYQSLVSKRKQRATKGSWVEGLAEKGDGFDVNKRFSQSLSGGITFQVIAQRLDWSHARCLVALTIRSGEKRGSSI